VGNVVGAAWMAAMVLAGLAAAGALDHTSWSRGSRAVGDVLTGASAVASLLLVSRIAQGPGRSVVRLARSLWFCVPYVLGLACLVSLLLAGRLELVVGVVLVAKSSDIGAYFAGKSFGKHKLAPSISPGKTVEGLVGGLLLPAVVGAFLLDGVVLGFSSTGPVPLPGGVAGAAVHGLVIGGLSALSDLSESLLKRSCEVKDSGTLFGESGGFLDLADSLLLVAPLVLAYTAVAS
jgi:CDP-diglyceride synthetase